ncbi:MAG: hypothetical protein DRO12_04580 [Thermoprotei archaeon]|nr:MAG: hypothetical protein DRO12_04580 [Thermoprotei archaeon]
MDLVDPDPASAIIKRAEEKKEGREGLVKRGRRRISITDVNIQGALKKLRTAVDSVENVAQNMAAAIAELSAAAEDISTSIQQKA